jgi:hypothetical protein
MYFEYLAPQKHWIKEVCKCFWEYQLWGGIQKTSYDTITAGDLTTKVSVTPTINYH